MLCSGDCVCECVCASGIWEMLAPGSRLLNCSMRRWTCFHASLGGDASVGGHDPSVLGAGLQGGWRQWESSLGSEGSPDRNAV
jgi:hypothetical protein